MAKDMHYEATATVTGGGTATVRIPDGFEARIGTPAELGGRGSPGTNAEQLLAAAYAACFYNALEFVAAERGWALPTGLGVAGDVRLHSQDGKFRLEVDVRVTAPQGDPAGQLDQLVAQAGAVWPHAEQRPPRVNVSVVPA
jgi:osmotically inducible protein OsmC